MGQSVWGGGGGQLFRRGEEEEGVLLYCNIVGNLPNNVQWSEDDEVGGGVSFGRHGGCMSVLEIWSN